MSDALATTDFSEAKAQLSELMTDVFHGHRPRLISRHRGKEQMLLVGREDLRAMLADQRLDVEVIHEGEAVTLRAPELGVLGFGGTYEEAAADLVRELEAYAVDYFANPTRYAFTSRAAHAAVLMRFALANADERLAMLAELPRGEILAR